VAGRGGIPLRRIALELFDLVGQCRCSGGCCQRGWCFLVCWGGGGCSAGNKWRAAAAEGCGSALKTSGMHRDAAGHISCMPLADTPLHSAPHQPAPAATGCIGRTHAVHGTKAPRETAAKAKYTAEFRFYLFAFSRTAV
jgi:hypothetical protein